MESPLENAAKYLNSRGLSISQVAQCIDNVMPWEAVIFGGSIPDGLANPQSDIDLMFFGYGMEHRGRVTNENGTEVSYRPALGPLRVQVEAVGLSHLESLAKRMRDAIKYIEDPSKLDNVHVFLPGDLKIIHRLRNGIPLHNPEIAQIWSRRLNCEVLPSYMLVMKVAYHFTVREDAIGEIAEARHASALWLMRDALSQAAGALLASIGETQPNGKWTIKLLQLHRAKLGVELSNALIAQLTNPIASEPDQQFKTMTELSDRVIEAAVKNRLQVLPLLMKLKNELRSVETHSDRVPMSDKVKELAGWLAGKFAR